MQARTTTFSKSCIPSASDKWNNLEAPIRECDSYDSFCATLKMQSLNKIPNYFLGGKIKFSVLHARLRNSCSSLNQDLYDNHLRHDSICTCLRVTETAEHYFFECEHFVEQRIHLFRETRDFHPLNVDMLLKAKESLSDSGFFNLFKIIYMPLVDLLTSPKLYSHKSLYDYMLHIQLCFNIFRLFFSSAIKRSCCKTK